MQSGLRISLSVVGNGNPVRTDGSFPDGICRIPHNQGSQRFIARRNAYRFFDLCISQERYDGCIDGAVGKAAVCGCKAHVFDDRPNHPEKVFIYALRHIGIHRFYMKRRTGIAFPVLFPGHYNPHGSSIKIGSGHGRTDDLFCRFFRHFHGLFICNYCNVDLVPLHRSQKGGIQNAPDILFAGHFV